MIVSVCVRQRERGRGIDSKFILTSYNILPAVVLVLNWIHYDWEWNGM